MSWLRRGLRTTALVACSLLAALIGLLAVVVPRRLRAGSGPLRSLWAGTPIPTLTVKALAERHLGVDARSLVLETYFLSHEFDHDLSAWRAKPLVGRLVAFAAFVWACWTADRVHFFCDRGLLPPIRERAPNVIELVVYRALRKQVYFWAYGADVRTRHATEALGEYHCCLHCPAPGRHCICDDERGSANQDRLARWSTARFTMGDMAAYVPGAIHDVFYWPIDLERDEGRRYEPAYPDPESTDALRVVHAANHRAFKGTSYLIDAVEQLIDEGVAIDLRLVEGLPNTEALAIYRSADVIFDQCLIGFHGYFAQEAMALGKPVLCFVRDRERMLLDPAACPIIDAPPTGIAAALRDLAEDRPRTARLGREGRRYIEAHHTPARFAGRLKAAYERLGVRVT